MNRCPICHQPIPLTKTYCSRKCASEGWKRAHSPILGRDKRRKLEEEKK